MISGLTLLHQYFIWYKCTLLIAIGISQYRPCIKLSVYEVIDQVLTDNIEL